MRAAQQLWLCLRFPSLPLESVTMLDDGMARTRPLAVVDAGHGRGVFDCNGAARAAGIRPGMSLATAFSLAATLACRPRDLVAEQARLLALAEFACGFSSQVSTCVPDAVVLEGARSLRLFGGIAPLRARVEAHFLALGHHCDAGIAHTPLAAELLARARVRLDSAEPAVVERALAHLPLRHTHWDARTLGQLHDSGLRTLGQVLALPRPALGRRHGQALLDYLARLTGAVADPRPPVVPRERFTAGIALPECVEQADSLLFPMRRLAADLTAWLQARQAGARAIAWHFGHPHRAASVLRIDFADAGADPARLLALSRLHLERRAGSLPAEVDHIALHALVTEPLRATDDDLFTMAVRRRTGHRELLDRLAARLGPEAIGGVEVVDAHPPELGWRHVDLVGDNHDLVGDNHRGNRHGGSNAAHRRTEHRTGVEHRTASGQRGRRRTRGDGAAPAQPSRRQETPPRPPASGGAAWKRSAAREDPVAGGRSAGSARGPQRIRAATGDSVPGKAPAACAQQEDSPATGDNRRVAGSSRPTARDCTPDDCTADHRAAAGSPPDGPAARIRPLWLLAEPRRITPARLQLLRGPERIEIPVPVAGIDAATTTPAGHQAPAPHPSAQSPARDPVQDKPLLRDYFVARDRDGALCWVFTCTGTWYLHGYFA
jgi:protein ImuB